MRRRDVIMAIASSLAGPSLVGHAQQQAGQTKLIGVFSGTPPNTPENLERWAAFRQTLQQFGWTEGHNLRIETRFGSTSDPSTLRKRAAELVALAPDVIVAPGAAAVGFILQATRTLPVVFVILPDPVGAGFVESLAQPGGNATGFMMFEYSLSAKWLELLKEIAPSVKRAAVLRDPTITSGIGQFVVIQVAAPSLGIDVRTINLRDPAEIERAVAAFAHVPNGGLILTASALSNTHHDLIIALADRYKLPAIYPERSFVAAGGLVSYGPNFIDQYRRAAAYVDRILKGEKPADMPVQAPTKYDLVINLKTAKALALAVPPSLLARADEVIE